MKKKNPLLIAALFFSFHLSAQINALFSVDFSEGCEPFVVQFSDESTSNGTIVSWDWDFDDGSTDDVPDPIHTFVGAGTSYNVCLTVTDDLAQSDTYCMTISVLDNPIAVAGPDTVLTCVTTSVQLSAAGSSTGPEFTYEWFDPNGILIGLTTNIEVNIPGEYTLIVTNTITGCTASDEVFVDVDVDLPYAEISVEYYCTFQVVLNIGNSSQGPNFSYEWQDGTGNSIGTDIEVFVSNEGLYTLIVTNTDNGCSASANFEVEMPAPIEVTVEITQEISCDGTCDGGLLVNASGGCPPYAYEWSNGENVPAVEGLCLSGIYGVTVTDCNGCTFTAEITMPEPVPMELSYDVTCATAANDGAIDLTVTGGTAPYTYFWFGLGASTEDVDNLAPGDYVVEVIDANGCFVDDTISLSNLILDMNEFNITACAGEEVQLFVDAPEAVSYLWFPADNLSCTDCPNPILTANLGGASTYGVIVEDANGCIDQGYFGIYVQSYLDFNLLTFSNSPVFEGETIEFNCNVINANSVEWSGPGSFSSMDCNPQITNADIDNEGEYTVEIIDENGCEVSAVVDVDVLTIIDTIEVAGGICLGDSYQLFVTAPNAISIEWSPAATLDDPFSNAPIATPDVSTSYFVTVEDAAGNVDVASVLVIIENVDLNIGGPPVACAGQNIVICTDAGYPGAYQWTGPNNFETTTPCFELQNVDQSMVGCYTVVYTSPAGCESEAQHCLEEVVQPPFITVDPIDPICAGDSVQIDLGVNPNMFYEWFPTTGLSCTDCPNPMASPAETTIYTVQLLYSATCNAVISIEVTVDEDCVWPGDTDTSKVVNNFDLLNIGLAYDSVGPIRPNASLLWEGQPAENWLIVQPGIDPDFKHIDCNGDGFINADDTLAITQNWGEVHAFSGDDDTEFASVDPPFYIDPDTLIEGESFSLPVILGEMDEPLEDVYGLAFTLEYDSAVVVPGSARMTFDNGWIGSKGFDMITIQKTFVSPGVVDVGMTRIDGEGMDGFGEIGQVFITIEDDILFRSEDDDSRNDDELEVIFNISNVRIINSLGEEIPVSPTATSTTVDGTVGTQNIPWKNYIRVQPNPASDAFFITTKNIELAEISLFAMTGELLLRQTPDTAETTVNTQKLLPGIYLLKVQTELGIMVEKIVIAK